MAKRYHHSERMGRMHPDTEMYAGMDERRKQERMDASMIMEDHKAIANLPQQVVMREYPKCHDYMNWESDDTEGGIRKQVDMDHGKMRKGFQPHKY